MAKALPVHGYQDQSEAVVELVNNNKIAEERLLRMIEMFQKASDSYDARWLAIAKTHLEQCFMALNRAILKPQRIDLEKVEK